MHVILSAAATLSFLNLSRRMHKKESSVSALIERLKVQYICCNIVSCALPGAYIPTLRHCMQPRAYISGEALLPILQLLLVA